MKHPLRLVLVLVALLVVVAALGRSVHRSPIASVPSSVVSTTSTNPTTTSSSTGHTTTTTRPAASRNPGLPNPRLTPGATNPAVTQATIYSTICVSGYSSSIRPPESYTYNLKVQQLDSGYNYRGDTWTHDYEEDHLVPLEVGGNPYAVANLWPQPWNVTWDAGLKDQLENRMHELVCGGSISLAAAQRVFETNWIVGYQRYVG